MTHPGSQRVRASGLTLAVCLLVIGCAAGFALRISLAPSNFPAPAPAPALASAPAPPTIPPRAATPENPSPPAQPDAATLSKQQWTKILTDPAAFTIRLENLRSPANAADAPIPVLATHRDLFGWDPETLTKVDAAVRAFSSALWDLEARSAEVSFPAENRIQVSYQPISKEAARLYDSLLENLRDAIGTRNTRQLIAVADLPGLKKQRGPNTVDRFNVQIDPDWGFITITSEHGPDEEPDSRIVDMKDAATHAQAFTSPAIDWEKFLNERRAVIPDPQ